MLLVKVLWTWAVLWHTLAFAAGSFCVYQSYRTLFNGSLNPNWAKVIRAADLQLWLSGIVIIGSGMLIAGWHAYLANPKLWTKSVLVIVWLSATLLIRHVAVPRLRAGKRQWMLWACSVSAACWVYGAFLGVAKPLANGAVSFEVFIVGFLLTILGCLGTTFHFEGIRTRALVRTE